MEFLGAISCDVMAAAGVVCVLGFAGVVLIPGEGKWAAAHRAAVWTVRGAFAVTVLAIGVSLIYGECDLDLSALLPAE